MRMIKVLDEYKSFMNRSDVKNACDKKIYKGLLTAYKEALAVATKENVQTEDLDKYYFSGNTKLKLFSLNVLNKINSSYSFKLPNASENVRKLDIYNKAMIFMTLIKLMYFKLSQDNLSKATIDELGISGAVFKRIKFIETLALLEEKDLETKNPKDADIKFLELGLKRIITMGVSDDDWNK